jgi:sugar porter (SP) family MFS transporter
MLLFGSMFGAVLGGYICDELGRRKSIFLCCFLFLVGSLTIGTAYNLSMILIGRFIIGLGVSLSAIVDVAYLTEISPVQHRGAVVSCNELMITIGFLLAYIINYAFYSEVEGWRMMFFFPIIIVFLWMLIMMFMPESPRWLLSKNFPEESAAVFMQIYGPEEAAHYLQLANESLQIELAADKITFMQLISEWKYPLIIATFLMISQQLSGNSALLTYSPEIFASLRLRAQSVYLVNVMLGVVKIISTGVTLILVDTAGRRSMFFIGLVGMIFGLAMIVVSSILSLPSLAVLGASSMVAAYSVGYGPISWIIVSEMFPHRFRGRVLGKYPIAQYLILNAFTCV